MNIPQDVLDLARTLRAAGLAIYCVCAHRKTTDIPHEELADILHLSKEQVRLACVKLENLGFFPRLRQDFQTKSEEVIHSVNEPAERVSVVSDEISSEISTVTKHLKPKPKPKQKPKTLPPHLPGMEPPESGVEPKEKTPRQEIIAAISESYFRLTGEKTPWTTRAFSRLDYEIKNTSWGVDQFRKCLLNREQSDDVNVGEAPEVFVPKLKNYIAGPLDQYHKTKRRQLSPREQRHEQRKQQFLREAIERSRNSQQNSQPEAGEHHGRGPEDSSQ